MLFDLKLEKVERSTAGLLIKRIRQNRFIISVLIASIIIAINGFLIFGAIFFTTCTVAFYLYNLLSEISAISFDTNGVEFGLQDVINDLENR